MFANIVKHGTLMTVIVLIICVLGIMAALRLPVQMIPDLDVRVITVRTYWPGATPQDVEREILIEQEQSLRNLPNLSRITATAIRGSARIELEFPFGTDINVMLIRVNNALNQVSSYPENVDEPTVNSTSFSANAFMFFYVSPLPGNPKRRDMDMVNDFLKDHVKPRMSSVAGVSDIGIWGGSQKQIQILIDAAKLAQRQLSLDDVRQTIRARNRDRSGGEIEAGKRRYLLRTIGRFDSLQDIENLILSRQQDALIRLKDVAHVQLDHFEKSNTASVNAEPVIFMVVRRESGSNVIDIKRDMLIEVAALNRDVLNPAGLQLKLSTDDVRYVKASLANVWQNLILGACLASLVMFLFLRSLKTTAIGVIGIPVCTIAGFLGLLLADRTINVISLAGIAFALGMTLDNTIVVLESIELERRKGAHRIQAAVLGVRHVWRAVLASTLTTVLVFIPVLFIDQEAGQLYSDIAIAIAAAIFTSMLVAITVVPCAASRIDFSLNGSADQPHKHRKTGKHRILKWVDWLLLNDSRRIGCILVTLASSACIIAFLTPAAEYLPEGEEPKTFARMSAPPGYNMETMQKIGTALEQYFVPFVDDDENKFANGESAVPSLRYFNLYSSNDGILVITEPHNARHIDVLMQALTDKFTEFPGMRAFAARGSIITNNEGGTRSINLDISGSRLQDIYRIAGIIDRRASEVFDNPRIRSNPASLNLSQPMVEVKPHWSRLQEVNMSTEQLGYAVAALTDGSYVDDVFLADDQVDLYLYSSAGQNARLDDLADLPIYTATGVVLPLSALATLDESVATSSVRRVNGQRTVTLNIIPPADIALETGVATVRTEVMDYLIDQGEIPANIGVRISGAADQLSATRDALTENYLVALIIIYLLLVAIFNHWGYPLLILITIPLGVAAGILGLWLLNAIGAQLPLIGLAPISQSFDMISMLGFLILMGTVVNNPILIVQRTIENMQQEGMEIIHAVQEAVEARLRPIAMSTITTVCGLAPLVFIPGAGTELYRGVGIIVMFGIIGTAVVTLTMLPALTVEVMKLKQRLFH